MQQQLITAAYPRCRATGYILHNLRATTFVNYVCGEKRLFVWALFQKLLIVQDEDNTSTNSERELAVRHNYVLSGNVCVIAGIITGLSVTNVSWLATRVELEITTTTMLYSCQCVIYAVITCIWGSYGCYIPPVEEKLYYSDVLAYGRVLDLHNEGFDLPDTKYMAEIQLYCVFKGGPLSPTINLSVPTYDSDPCETYDLTPDLKYLLYLDTTDGINRPTFNVEQVPDSEHLDYIPFLCDVSIQYPTGVDPDTSQETCPEPYDDPDHCTRYDPDYEDPDYEYIETDYRDPDLDYEESKRMYEPETKSNEPYELTESSDWTLFSTPPAEQISTSPAATVNICENLLSSMYVFSFILLTLFNFIHI